MTNISPEHVRWFRWWQKLCEAYGFNCVLAGGAALLHYLQLSENTPYFKPTDFDLFLCLPNPTECCVEQFKQKCGEETGAVAGPGATRVAYGECGNIALIADFHLHRGLHATRGSKIGLPVQLIVLYADGIGDGEFGRDKFWKTVVSDFDIDIVKVAVSDSEKMRQINIYSRQVATNLLNHDMLYHMTDRPGGNSATMWKRIHKYTGRGFELKGVVSPDCGATLLLDSGEEGRVPTILQRQSDVFHHLAGYPELQHPPSVLIIRRYTRSSSMDICEL